MMAMTTSSSIRVNANSRDLRTGWRFIVLAIVCMLLVSEINLKILVDGELFAGRRRRGAGKVTSG